ncbi:CoA ester lyase [Novosphingobium sp.]|uniref:HpcH/HpaI aldolase/citrate lyase family protein n=1 Tax=Novosphingobium sp. TaxID=1874826 RepID=UPI0022C79A56|nr:CoA ester lyase [Novosphingobium sp.]MCZ8018199.1 CoA ester lyase [Novosphingobium sp.]MCZ8033193.1 CoA ester lyase [Novosphingobium sp.]MCZ8051648.1 CoA ester lyase [Novosphingobium sp.]MCZ8060190.1 CoA ester lyase [Novosphingobium sp.]MCZ8231832.1 CoA ester lyase [Novosphingobium sp.]
MAMRSWLFVPGDSEKKLGKAAATGADVIIVDLEDSVAPANKPRARELAREWLGAHRHQVAERKFGRWVRINALDSRMWRDDLVAVLPGAPDGIMLPKSAGPESVQALGAELYELEQRSGLATGSVKILPLVSETAAAAISIPAYASAPLPRLAGLTWGGEDLSAAIGASRKYDKDGRWTDAFRLVRAQTLLTAHARGVIAIDTLHADFADTKGLKRIAEEARADGFTGMLAIHPAQVPVINEAFTPTEAELEEARAIVAAFAGSPDAGTLQIDRRMIDRPHLTLARRMLGIEG